MVIARSCTLADIDFQGKHQGEQFKFQFHQHWIRLLWPITKLLLYYSVIVGIGYTIFLTSPTFQRPLLTMLSIAFVMVSFEFLIRLYRFLLYVVVLTDSSVHRIKKSLLFMNDHISLDLSFAQDICKSQNGLIQNLLGFGSITIEAQETHLRLHFVPRVGQKYDEIVNLHKRTLQTMSHRAMPKPKHPPPKTADIHKESEKKRLQLPIIR